MYKARQIDDCLAHLEVFTKKYPTNANGWALLGDVYLLKDKFDQAVTALKQAVKLDANHKFALNNLAMTCRIKGFYSDAQKLYYKVLKLDPNFTDIHSSLCVLETYKKNYDKAIQLGKKALALNKSNSIICGNLAIAYYYNKNIEQADEYYLKAIKLGFRDNKVLKLILSGKIPREHLYESPKGPLSMLSF